MVSAQNSGDDCQKLQEVEQEYGRRFREAVEAALGQAQRPIDQIVQDLLDRSRTQARKSAERVMNSTLGSVPDPAKWKKPSKSPG
jgi:hypothetical protein